MQENEPVLPPGFRVGKATTDGNCFFDSFKQGLGQLGMSAAVEELREYCKEFAQNNPPEWFINAIANSYDNNGVVRRKTPDSYAKNILNNNRWGDSEVEGRILCGKYGVKLYVMERHVVDGKEVWTNQIINSEEGSKNVDNIDYNEENTIHIINRGHGHFIPILRKQNDRGSGEPLNDLEKKIEGYLGESSHFVDIFGNVEVIYLGRYNNQDCVEERNLKFAVLTNKRDSEGQQIVRCYTISYRINSPDSRFSEEEMELVRNKLPDSDTEGKKRAFVFQEYKMFTGKERKGNDRELVCKSFSEKQEFTRELKCPYNEFVASIRGFGSRSLFSPVRASTPIARRNIPKGHDKAYAYKFLENLLRIEMSPDVLVDIIVDSKDDTKIAVVGRPKVLGSSTKQMRHVISYSSVKNDKAIFRSGMANKLIGKILSSKIVSHVIIHLVPYRYLKDGFMESAVEEGLGNGMQKILKSFIDLVQQDYINAPFHERIGEVLNDDWVNRTLEKYQEQNQSFSEASSIIIEESDTKRPPEEGGIDETHIEKLPREGGVSDIEQRLKGKGIKENIYIKEVI